MKNLIAASIIALSSSAAMAEAFDFERQFGTSELFPTLITEQIATTNSGSGGSASFAYERAIGAPELFPTLLADGAQTAMPLEEVIADNVPVQDTIWGWNFSVGG